MPGLDVSERGERPFAVIDVGSNSARMIVFRLRHGEHLDVLEDARAPLRLAHELGDDDRLGEAAIDRTIEALRDFQAVADGASVRRIIAIATSAVREAADGDELVERARAIGIPLEVIDGDLEARLGFVGAVHDLPVVHGATIDVGGGTTEIARFHDRRIGRSWTLPLGSLRLTDRFLGDDPPSESSLKDARKSIEAAFDDADVRPLEPGDALVGIGGSVRNLAKVDRRRRVYPLPLLHGYELTEAHLAGILEDLAGRSVKARTKVGGLNPDRADSIVAGGLIVRIAMKILGADRVIVSSRGLREGLALGGSDADLPEPSFVRRISLVTLAGRFSTWDARLAERRASFADDLFARLAPRSPELVREMLGHAARVVDVGRAIDYYDRFVHAATILARSDLAGFTHEALGACTAILRQADDDANLGPFARLVGKELRPHVLQAATLLSLADDLNRRVRVGDGVALTLDDDGRTVHVGVPIVAGWRPRGVADRFRRVFGRSLSIVPLERPRRVRSQLAPE